MKTINNIALISSILVIISCNKAEVVTCDGGTPTYNSEIKTIIDNNCVTCHDAGNSHGDYTSYATFESHRTSGKFENRVLLIQDMPAGSNSGLKKSELNLIQCWLENGFAEN